MKGSSFGEDIAALLIALTTQMIGSSGAVKDQSMPPQRGWFRENVAGLLVAIIGLVGGIGGAFLGASYGASGQVDLWRKEKVHQNTLEVMNKRLDIFRNIARLSVDAQRAKALVNILHLDEQAVLVRMSQCKDPSEASKPRCLEEVKFPIEPNVAGKELAELQANYIANVQMAAIYFCDKTQKVIEDMNKHSDKKWWELEPEIHDSLLAATGNEIKCNLNFDYLLR